jgi:thioesterase domain-containing protein
MPMHAPSSALATLRGELDRIPLTRAMGLSVADFDGASLALAAPLAPNVNDKGCAFGGSLASLMTLAGWGLLELVLQARAMHADIYVQDSSIRYLAPVWHDFRAIAAAAPGESLDAFAATLAERGKARLRVHCRVPLPDDGDAATLDARFVALVPR